MTRSIVQTVAAPPPIGSYSQAIRSGDMLFVSGQIPLDPKTGEIPDTFSKQTHRVLLNLKAVLEAGGSSLDQVLKVTIYMQNLDQFDQMNQIYAEYFGSSKPARACVEVSALPKGVGLEIEAIAAAQSRGLTT